MHSVLWARNALGHTLRERVAGGGERHRHCGEGSGALYVGDRHQKFFTQSLGSAGAHCRAPRPLWRGPLATACRPWEEQACLERPLATRSGGEDPKAEGVTRRRPVSGSCRLDLPEPSPEDAQPARFCPTAPTYRADAFATAVGALRPLRAPQGVHFRDGRSEIHAPRARRSRF